MEQPTATGPTWQILPYPRRVRGYLSGRAVIDSQDTVLLLGSDRLPTYHLPPADVAGTLRRSQRPDRPGAAGLTRYWDLLAGDLEVPDAATSLAEPVPALAGLAGLVAPRWSAMQSWFEEDDEVFVHPREPFHRVDVLHSSRHVVVSVADHVVADSHRPRLLFETGLPVRYYLPLADVRLDLLRPSDTSTACPYKGVASYHHVLVDGRTHADLAWSYRFPVPECPKIAGLVAFYDEKVDTVVDGVPRPRPGTHWS